MISLLDAGRSDSSPLHHGCVSQRNRGTSPFHPPPSPPSWEPTKQSPPEHLHRSHGTGQVSAFMMRSQRVGPRHALARVRSARKWTNPNPSFMDQLQMYADRHQLTHPASHPSHEETTNMCELCALRPTTRWFNSLHPDFVVLECDQCDNPMVVARAHGMEIESTVQQEMQEALQVVADKLMGEGQWYRDTQQRTIATHLHWHARSHTALSRAMQGWTSKIASAKL